MKAPQAVWEIDPHLLLLLILSTFQTTPPPPQCSVSIPTQCVSGLLFFWVHFRFTSMDFYWCGWFSGFLTNDSAPREETDLEIWPVFVRRGRILRQGSGSFFFILLSRCSKCSVISRRVGWDVLKPRPALWLALNLPQDPWIHSGPGRGSHQRRLLQGLQSVERCHPTHVQSHHGRRGRHHDQLWTQR